MARKFEKEYRVRQQDRMGERFFNSRFLSIDKRLHALETIGKDWKAAVDEIARFGLRRIDEFIRPAIDEIKQLTGLGWLHVHVEPDFEVVWQTGAQDVSLDASTSDARIRIKHFRPSPFVVLTRESTPDDYLVARQTGYTIHKDDQGDITGATLSLDVKRVTGSPSGGQAGDVWVYASPGAAEAIADFTQRAETARDTSVSAKDTSVSAKNTAVGAKDTAVTAKNQATTARDEAQAAATDAEDAAASVDLPDSLSGHSEQQLQVRSDESGYQFVDRYTDSDASAAAPVQTVNGRTGDVEVMPSQGWQIKTSDFTASSRGLYMVGAGITLTLPSGPSQGDFVRITPARDWKNTNSTVARNGENIQGGDENLTLDTNLGLTFVYVDGTWGWSILGA